MATSTSYILLLLCFVCALIALLQVAVSLSNGIDLDRPSITHTLGKRQTVVETSTYTASAFTVKGSTYVIPERTVTYGSPPSTITYPLSTKTITQETVTYSAHTDTEGYSIITAGGSTRKQYFGVYVSDGVTSTVLWEATTTDDAYLDATMSAASLSGEDNISASDNLGVQATSSQTRALDQSLNITTISTETSFTTQQTGSAFKGSYLDPNIPSYNVQEDVPAVSTSTKDSFTWLEATTTSDSFNLPWYSSTHSSTISTSSVSAYLSTTVPAVVSSHSPITHSMHTSPPATTVVPVAIPETVRIVKGHYTTPRYYLATYLPSLLFILLKVLWSVVFASAILQEPFHQMTSTRGARPATSILAGFLRPAIGLKSMLSPAILVGMIITILTTALAPIAADSMSIRGTAKCSTQGQTRACLPTWSLDMICVRLLQALLAVTSLCLVAFLMLSFRRRATFLNDPSSIATVTSLLKDKEFIAEIRSLPPVATDRELRRSLSGNRYALGFSRSATGRETYGIIKTNNHHMPNLTACHAHKPRTRASTSFRRDVPVLLAVLILLGLIVGYWFDGNKDPFNDFFNSNGFGPRFLMSALATILDYLFKRLEREVRVMTPWRTILDTTKSDWQKSRALKQGLPGTCYTSLPVSVWSGQWFAALVSGVAILGDILVVVIVGVPFSDTELYIAFRISLWMSISILGLMGVTVITISLWWRGANPKIELPDTILRIAQLVLTQQAPEIRERVSLLDD